jgi:hypothetical protein
MNPSDAGGRSCRRKQQAGEREHPAGSKRAQIYALYHLADCLATGKPSAEWAVERRPRVPKHYGWPSAGNVSSPIFRPDQFKQVIEEMPALGINGVLITCTSMHGTDCDATAASAPTGAAVLFLSGTAGAVRARTSRRFPDRTRRSFGRRPAGR